MISLFIVALIGGISNRIRGGWLTDIVRKMPKTKGILESIGLFGYRKSSGGEVYYVKDFNALLFTSIMASKINVGQNWLGIAAFAIIYSFMKLGASMGWGGYISAMIDEKIDHNRDDVKLLDKWFRGNDEAVLSGWAALSLRGFVWTNSLYLGFMCVKYLGYSINNNFYYMPLLGLAMGTIYLLSVEICERVTFRGNGWQWGEIAFGAYYFGGIYCII